jgi:diguanylate cyclase (GGDEF)-like protein/PAS domain S-box-containing protein
VPAAQAAAAVMSPGVSMLMSRRILLWSVLLGLLSTAVLAGLQLHQRYQLELARLQDGMQAVEDHLSFLLPPGANSSGADIQGELDGLRQLTGLSYLRLVGADGETLAVTGRPAAGEVLSQSFSVHTGGMESGGLLLVADLSELRQAVLLDLPAVLLSEGLKVLLLFLLLLSLLPTLLNRWLLRLLDTAQQMLGEARASGPVANGAAALTELIGRLQRRQLALGEEAARSRDWFNRLYLDGRDPILMLHPASGKVLEANPAAGRLLGYRHGEMCGLPIASLYPEHMTDFERFASRVIKDRSGWTAELSCRHRGGHDLAVEVSASLIEHPQGEVILATIRDQSERRQVQEQIEQLAYHDALTGLPNRMLLRDRLEMALARSRRSGQRGPLLFLDVDNFKTVNDSLGHPAGDRLLQEVGTRLHRALRQDDTVARLGGDEFVVLPELVSGSRAMVLEQAMTLVEKLGSSLERPFHLDGHDIHVTLSVGVATFPDDGETVDELLRRAESALYKAKSDGRDTTHFYSPELEEGMSRRLTMGTALRRALANEEFELVFQPQVAMPERRPVAAEALVRWRQPGQGLVSPAEFLPYMEEMGLMTELGFWVLDQVCHQWRQAREQCVLPEGFRMAVNVAAQQFRNPAFVQMVRSVLEENDMPGSSLELELTEQALVLDLEDAAAKINALRELGVSFAIDDFGTGYSSLSYLHRLPVDTVKIDRSFVGLVGQQNSDAALVDVIIGMGHRLGLRVVAEGVENEAQAFYLDAHGCEVCQGYLFGRPVSWEVLCAQQPHASGELYG